VTVQAAHLAQADTLGADEFAITNPGLEFDQDRPTGRHAASLSGSGVCPGGKAQASVYPQTYPQAGRNPPDLA
jgi:hypothetical protein